MYFFKNQEFFLAAFHGVMKQVIMIIWTMNQLWHDRRVRPLKSLIQLRSSKCPKFPLAVGIRYTNVVIRRDVGIHACKEQKTREIETLSSSFTDLILSSYSSIYTFNFTELACIIQTCSKRFWNYNLQKRNLFEKMRHFLGLKCLNE